jgi:hypothetical protein
MSSFFKIKGGRFMNKTQANITITDRGKTLFTTKANLNAEGKKSNAIDLSLKASELNELFDALQDAKRKQQEATARRKAERIEKQANRLVDEMNQLTAIQQFSYLSKRVVLPTVKRWFNRDQNGGNQDE